MAPNIWATRSGAPSRESRRGRFMRERQSLRRRTGAQREVQAVFELSSLLQLRSARLASRRAALAGTQGAHRYNRQVEPGRRGGILEILPLEPTIQVFIGDLPRRRIKTMRALGILGDQAVWRVEYFFVDRPRRGHAVPDPGHFKIRITQRCV